MDGLLRGQQDLRSAHHGSFAALPHPNVGIDLPSSHFRNFDQRDRRCLMRASSYHISVSASSNTLSMILKPRRSMRTQEITAWNAKVVRFKLLRLSKLPHCLAAERTLSNPRSMFYEQAAPTTFSCVARVSFVTAAGQILRSTIDKSCSPVRTRLTSGLRLTGRDISYVSIASCSLARDMIKFSLGQTWNQECRSGQDRRSSGFRSGR